VPKVCLEEKLVQPLLELELMGEYNSGLPNQRLLLQLHSGMPELIVCRVTNKKKDLSFFIDIIT
jgi:hypothetical protein